MKKYSLKDILIPILSLFLIACVTTALLAFTNSVTKDAIASLDEEKALNSRLELFSNADSFNDMGDYFTAVDEKGDILGYTFDMKGKGYGGDISLTVGIDVGGTVTGVIILNHSETPGLGGNCVNVSFTDEYKQSLPDGGFYVVKDGSGKKDGKIDALTGATITSNAVTKAVNDALEIYKNITKG